MFDARGGGKLEESDERGEHPAHREANKDVITNVLRDLIANGPEDGAIVAENVPGKDTGQVFRRNNDTATEHWPQGRAGRTPWSLAHPTEGRGSNNRERLTGELG